MTKIYIVILFYMSGVLFGLCVNYVGMAYTRSVVENTQQIPNNMQHLIPHRYSVDRQRTFAALSVIDEALKPTKGEW